MNSLDVIDQDIVNTFQETYYHLQNAMEASLTDELGDSVVLERLLDELANLSGILWVHGTILDPEEAVTIETNVVLLVQEVSCAHRHVLDSWHYGRHHPVMWIYTGRRPQAVIDPKWDTVREALITNGLATQQEYPFNLQYIDIHTNKEDDVWGTDSENTNKQFQLPPAPHFSP
ncbi:hypothetical protein FRC05_004502 [Tulasnella sp. 425]|nr:hypothetical protein FRC05_004502 [Tulasnella sp. 425]